MKRERGENSEIWVRSMTAASLTTPLKRERKKPGKKKKIEGEEREKEGVKCQPEGRRPEEGVFAAPLSPRKEKREGRERRKGRRRRKR